MFCISNKAFLLQPVFSFVSPVTCPVQPAETGGYYMSSFPPNGQQSNRVVEFLARRAGFFCELFACPVKCTCIFLFHWGPDSQKRKIPLRPLRLCLPREIHDSEERS